jgi:hypothetical protein
VNAQFYAGPRNKDFIEPIFLGTFSSMSKSMLTLASDRGF